ncbi:DMT family transporter [Chlorobium ferrooxidans]|uniref:Small multidrug resistance protein n=1 Tax=Chlorobium ferrooxidans DSM 13031 TaxID=377431 RepID=Q0YS90_9CHLB|nr:multidrug efflux SMR transporter [Chlorobium ferrooxidans]EAT59101.1 Small multidrug resistance protein [Chlorobium ferrooxidans DSM 13031]
MHWIYLIIAILFEVSGTTCMKFSFGFSKLVPSLFIFIFYALSFTFLSLALKVLPVALSYAIWSGVGTAAITVIGIFWFGEGINAIKLISLLLIIIGVAGLHFGQEQVH